jgi:hypothetical protein
MSMLHVAVTGRGWLARCRAALCCGGLLFGCGGPEFEDVPARHDEGIVNGETSPASQNAIVVVYYDEATWGTGSLVAPNLVLTSRHLLFEEPEMDVPGVIECNPDDSTGGPVGRVRNAADILVMFGEKFPMRETARGKQIRASNQLDLCSDDLALLEIDREVSIEPLPLRLDLPTDKNELGRAVGWGLTDARRRSPPGSLPSLTGKRNQIFLQIEEVGPAVYSLPDGGAMTVARDTFVTGASGCYGDSGAPFLSAVTGAIIGTLTSFEPDNLVAAPIGDIDDCYESHATFRSLAPEREWILEAFRDAGAAPWFEGLARPAASGDACNLDEECVSGRCVITASTSLCSASCDADPCAAGQQCIEIDGGHWCVPERLEEEPQTSSSCGVSRFDGTRPSQSVYAILAFGLAGWFRRRRGGPSRCAPHREECR